MVKKEFTRSLVVSPLAGLDMPSDARCPAAVHVASVLPQPQEHFVGSTQDDVRGEHGDKRLRHPALSRCA